MLKYFLLALVVFAVLANAQDDEEEEDRGRPVRPFRPVDPVRPVDRDLPATPEIDAMVRKVEREVRAVLGQNKVKKFKAESYRKNFPIIARKMDKGTVYFVKVWHLFLFNSNVSYIPFLILPFTWSSILIWFSIIFTDVDFYHFHDTKRLKFVNPQVNTGDCKKRTILRIFSDRFHRSFILQGIKTGTVKTHPIEYFDGNLDQFRD